MNAPSSRTCPSCGATASGKFCSECGASLGNIDCPRCGAKLPAPARFCSECGATVAAGGRLGAVASRGGATTGGEKVPWIVAGVAVLALLGTVVVVVSRRSGAPAEPAATGGGFGQATTDLAQMTPREAADRLFNRVMMASEAGDTAQVQFFAPMALQAYSTVDSLDADARLHVGLIALKSGAPEAAAAQADTIQRRSPTHLFALYLQAQAASAQGNTAIARRAYRGFLDNYEAERAKNLWEYGEHNVTLLQARDEAQRAIVQSTRP